MKKYFMLLLLITSTRLNAQTSYYITGADSAKLFVQEFGKGEPVIFLAGGPGLDAIYMEPVWKELSSKYRCIVLDQRGTGKSVLPAVNPTTINMDNYVNDIDVLRMHLQLDQLTLLGHSWGGALAMAYAARHPLQTKRLILLNSAGPTGKFFSYFDDNIHMRLHDEDLKQAAMDDSLKKPGIAAIWPGYFFDRKRALATRGLPERLHANPSVGDIAFAGYLADEKERVILLENYKGPVYIIQGRQDPIGESTAYEIKELMPQTNIRFIEKCGHFPWLENDKPAKEFFEALYVALK